MDSAYVPSMVEGERVTYVAVFVLVSGPGFHGSSKKKTPFPSFAITVEYRVLVVLDFRCAIYWFSS